MPPATVVENPEQNDATSPTIMDHIQSDRIPVRVVLQDIVHGVWRFSDNIPMDHPVRADFIRSCIMGLLVWDKEDLQKYENVQIRLHKERGEHLDFVRHCYNNISIVAKHVKRRAPQPSIMAPVFMEILAQYKDIKDSSGCCLLSPKALREASNLMEHIKKGCLSDPPPESGIVLQVVRSHDKDGLQVLHRLRGSNSVEGSIHSILERNNSKNCGARLFDCYLRFSRASMNIHARSKYAPGFQNIGHTDLQLLELQQTLHNSVYGFESSSWWESLEQFQTREKEFFGIVPYDSNPENWEEFDLDDPRIKHLAPDRRYLAMKQKSLVYFS